MAALAIPAVLVLFLVLSSTFDFSWRLGVFDFKRVAQGFVLLLLFAMAAISPGVRAGLAQQMTRIPLWMAAALLLALGLGWVSALRFPHPGYGLAEVAVLALLVCGLLVIAACRALAGRAFDRLVLAGLALLGAAVAIQELMGLLAAWALGIEFSFEHMLIHFAHPRFYNQLQSWSLPLLASLPLVFPDSRKVRVLAVLLLGLQWCLLLISGGRGSALAVLLSIVIVAAVAGGHRQGWLRWHILGLGLGAALFAAVLAGHAAMAPAGGSFVEQSVGRPLLHTTGRSHMWKMALADAARHPWLGAGPMRFNCEGLVQFPAHPHNFPLQLAAEWGLPATALVLVVCAALAWALLRHLISMRRGAESPARGHGPLQSLLAAGLLAAALHAGLSGVLNMPASQMMAVLVGGWLLGALPRGRPGAMLSGGAAALAVLGLALALSVAVAAFNVREAAQLEVRTELLRGAGPAQPRYWQNGKSCYYRYDQAENRTSD
jgi:O-antigen ligase